MCARGTLMKRQRRRIWVNGPFWKAVLSSDDELFDVDIDLYHGYNSGVGPSSVGVSPSSHGTDSVCKNEVVDETIRDTARGKMPTIEEEEHV
ncbi:hypothetical protein CJ030_MR6G010429 [Morella rubra]|uniref:Uncharacterized protein n=1 Tax=Morella rubra TaxID=262757 RepID=A0A6A1VAM5_9ROSI|nr:hypothetical protein CJ030_MR6G010429 [Morella rubra]